MKQYSYFITVLLAFSCGSSPEKGKTSQEQEEITSPTVARKTADPQSKPEDRELQEYYQSLLIPGKSTIGNYELKYGYTAYNEEKYGFQNPGYFQVYSKGKLIFKDQFKGEGAIYIKSLGYHQLSGKKLVLVLHYGTEACDYSQVARYYMIDSNQKGRFLRECYSSCGGDGYACHFYDQVFPEDSIGVANTILFIEGFRYLEHDEEDQIDTTKMIFTAGGFSTKKTVSDRKQ